MDPNTFLSLGTLTPKNLQEITCYEKLKISKWKLSFGILNLEPYNVDPNTFLSLGTLTPKNLQEFTRYRKIRINIEL